MNKKISTAITEENIAQVINLLSSSTVQLDNLYSRFSEEEFAKPLEADEWSLTEILAHLLHCEALSSEYIYQALLKDDVIFTDIHPEREYGKLLRLNSFSFKSLLDYFLFRRKVFLGVLSSLHIDQWSRSFSVRGKKKKETVYWRARTLALHELQHMDAIEKYFPIEDE